MILEGRGGVKVYFGGYRGLCGEEGKGGVGMGVNVEMDIVEGENGLRRGIGRRWRGKRA